jgi:phosphoglycerol transferase MdoB-like AlkP superfamily enzyme
MIWGVNDWDTVATRPPGSFIENNTIHSPMTKEGDHYVLMLHLPDSTSIEYCFGFTKLAGPFNIYFGYYDINEKPDNKFYHLIVHGNKSVYHTPDTNKVKPITYISLINYTTLFFSFFLVLALLIFGLKKVILKSEKQTHNPVTVFFSIFFSLVIILLLIRAYITDLSVQFLYSPLSPIPLIIKTSYQDFIYTCLLSLPFGIILIAAKTKRNLVLWLYVIFAIISILFAMMNIKVIAILGRPFTYQWMYYSDFLYSTDAKKAIGANIDKITVFAYLLMCFAIMPLTWLFYQLLKKYPYVTILIFSSCLLLGYISKDDPTIGNPKKENPVMYFLSSLTQHDGISVSSNKESWATSEFIVKNKNILMPSYENKFRQAGIKNVVFFVLESTPAEYITPYNPTYNATPFLNSIKSSAVLFDAFYAHAPATNKSMVSMLCGTLPYLSYKTITAEKPAIEWPSITSELKSSGYRTSFFNSGDNRFLGAENFLKNRKMDTVQDFRTGACNEVNFSKERFANKNLDGIKDSCLTVNFLNWVDTKDTRPFFSMIWTFQTHYPYYSTGKSIDFNTNNEFLGKYLNGLHEGDEALKELVEGLQKRNLLNSTLIIVVGDHGEAFGRHGQTSHAGGIYEENLHIPLILINPILFHGEHLTQVGGISDIAPTIFSIINKPIPENWQGENLFSINRRKKVYFFNPYSDILFGFREGDFKFIYNATGNVYSLFDLKKDPHEEYNIADKNKPYVEESKKQLNAWIHYQTDFVNGFLK